MKLFKAKKQKDSKKPTIETRIQINIDKKIDLTEDIEGWLNDLWWEENDYSNGAEKEREIWVENRLNNFSEEDLKEFFERWDDPGELMTYFIDDCCHIENEDIEVSVEQVTSINSIAEKISKSNKE